MLVNVCVSFCDCGPLQEEQEDDSGASDMSGLERLGWVFAVGMTCGAAISVKWTGLATPAFIALESLLAVFGFVKRPVETLMLLAIGVVAVAQYTLWFWIHFQLLPLSGGGDGFMPVEFMQTLEVGAHSSLAVAAMFIRIIFYPVRLRERQRETEREER